MRKNFLLFILASLIMLSGLTADALEIVYPKKNPSVKRAESTFFIGNVTPGSKLTINGNNIKIWEDGSFVQVVPLHDGVNNFFIVEKNNSKTKKITFKIKKYTPKYKNKKTVKYHAYKANHLLYAKAIKNYVPLRIAPDGNAPRITHLSKATALVLEGKKGRYYKVKTGTTESIWVAARDIVICSKITERLLARVCNVEFDDDKDFQYLRINLTLPVAYKVKEDKNNLELNIYGLKYSKELIDKINSQTTFESIVVKSTDNNNFVIDIPSDQKLWGYDCYYGKGNQLVFKKRKAPVINPNKPLDGITITVDAGHGGKDKGAIGPTNICEKEVNLDIAKKLEKELKEAGAKVIMTRDEEKYIGLYERVDLSKEKDSLISISIHANALPDGKDPMVKHGSSAFYYHKEAKDLAMTLKNQMVSDLKTKDDGCSKGSYVLTRATSPLSVLVEIAYMIYPPEYLLLKDESFKQKAAESIRRGLEKYFLDELHKELVRETLKMPTY